MELIKPWNNGGNLTVTYDGSGDGSAVFSSSENTGDTREMAVSFVDSSRQVIIVRTVRQAGKIITEETYTPLTYIECTGEQYIDLGYVVKETDTIDVDYFATVNAGGEKMLFGVSDEFGSVSWSISSTTGYARFGSNTNSSIARGYYRYNLILNKELAKNGTASLVPTFSQMPQQSLYLFAKNNNGTPAYFGYFYCYVFRITDANGNIIKELRPVKRNSDGKIGMLDLVERVFYSSQSNVDFTGGLEVQLDDEYSILDTIDFNADKIYDTNIYINEKCVIETKIQNGEPVTTSKYMYGVLTTGNTESVAAYLARSGVWRFGTPSRSVNTQDFDEHILIHKQASVTKDRTSYSNSGTANSFVTPYTLPIGGSISATGVYSKSFIGKIFYIKITEGDSLLLYWIPVRRNDGVEGFWDCVTQSFVEPM